MIFQPVLNYFKILLQIKLDRDQILEIEELPNISQLKYRPWQVGFGKKNISWASTWLKKFKLPTVN